jgi:hypothetical protein
VSDVALPRLRQAVVAVRDLDAVAVRLRDELGLAEPFSDPAVGMFGLRNAVFTLGDTFLEVVSPVREGTSAGRLLERRGGDCGYMLMFQVADVALGRSRAEGLGLRTVFEVELDDMVEVHLHPSDIRAAIVSLSAPRPPSSWRWGGPGWEERAAPLRVAGATVAVADAQAVAACWRAVLDGEPPGIELVVDEEEPRVLDFAVVSEAVTREQVVDLEQVRIVVRPR